MKGKIIAAGTGLAVAAFGMSLANAQSVGERPVVEQHVDQANIDNGSMGLDALIDKGRLLFNARFNSLDGRGRPATTGGGAPRNPLQTDGSPQPAFLRTSAPDANACGGCHAQPGSGGAGDFVANVFVLAQVLDPVTESVNGAFSNERNTNSMFGGGPIEMLAREMSSELIAIREQAAQRALFTGAPARAALVAKGVRFGHITVLPDGRVDPTEIDGVDWDLIVKPFHQKGAVVSLREFTNNAMNHHHGMQSVERFGENLDPDLDGHVNELTVGDITATAVFQAALGTPVFQPDNDPARRAAAHRGRGLFHKAKCAGCHVPAMRLESRFFTEPNPFNPPGNLTPADVLQVFSFDMTSEGSGPRLERRGEGAIVRAFTDLKRYNLCDEDYNHFCNEQVTQGSLVGFASPSDFTVPAAPRPTEEFLSNKLWVVGNSDPYGHRGDLTTITEAIYQHGGEARESRDTFFAMPQDQQDAIVEFLRSLVMVTD